MYDVTKDPVYAAYCQFWFEFQSFRLREAGRSDMVRRIVFDVPEFPYGNVLGYIAAGMAAVARARASGTDLEQAMAQLKAAQRTDQYDPLTHPATRDPKVGDLCYRYNYLLPPGEDHFYRDQILAAGRR